MADHPLGISPSAVYAVHQNYRSRIAERGVAAPAVPSYFLKPPATLASSGEALVRPAGCELLTFEGEVAIVIGRSARRVSPEQALGYVAGLTAANDVGVADLRWADGGSNVRSKGQDGFTPLAATLVPVAAAEGLVLRTYVNGVVVQDTARDELLFSFAQLVADLSRFTTLAAGDVILSGTPAGASIARPGDLIEVEIVGGPRVSNPVMQSDVPVAAFGAQPRVDDAERQRAYGARPPVAAAGSGATVGTQLDPARRDELTTIGTATLSAQLRKLGVDHHSVAGLRSAADGARFAGTAQTLRYLPQREDRFERIGNGFNAQKRAVDRLAVGEVLVIDARGVPDAGTIGDLLVRTAMVRGAAGIVTDGGLRDVEATAALGLPVFYATPNPAVLGHRHVPVDTGLPIACGGALVEPGDVVVGDSDGVIVIPVHLLDAALAGARQQLLEETYIQERIVAGDGLEGLYPLSATTRPGFEAWLARRPDPVSSDSKERT